MNSFLSRIITILSAIILISLSISSCDSVLNQKSPTSTQTQSAPSQTNILQPKESQSLNHDQKMARLAKKIPGLGGLFLNDSGHLTVYLTQPANQRAKAAAIFSSFKPLTKTLARLRSQGQKYRSASVSNMNIKNGQYTFTKLYTWRKNAADKLLAMDGVYSIDIDESQNKLSVGVKGKAEKTKVSKKLAELNVPKKAVTIFEMSPPELMIGLRDEVSSFSGGIKITINNGPSWCSMGLPVRWRENPMGSFKSGYITASHCTPPLGGGVNSTQFYQPVSGGNYAGIEIRDPLFAGNKCWDTGQNCRESDAALIRYSNANPDLVSGSIYKTTSKGRDNGSRTIPTYGQRFYVKGIDNFIPENITNHKIGARTGWTYGPVTDICRDFTVSGITVVCQNVVQAGVDGGDSGAPVFETTADPDSVIFAGILSGSLVENGTEYFWYSSVTRVKNELSGSNVIDLTFTAPPPPLSVFMSGTFYITQNGSYTWEADAEHGDGNYSYQWQYASNVGGPWTTVASTQTYTRLVTKTDQTQHFYLRVNVSSGSEQLSSTRQVTVTSNDCPPNQICPQGG